MVDHYETLGVGPHASQRQIRRAYRRLALRHHPDHNPHDPEAEDRFKTIAAAYRVLSDPVRRADYDRTCSTLGTEPRGWTAPPPRPPSAGPPDVTSELRRDSFRSTVPLDFRDAYLGALLSVSITLASGTTRQIQGFLAVVAICLMSGLAISWPFMRMWNELSRLVAIASIQLPVMAAVLVLAAGGAFVGSTIVVENSPSVFGGSGLPYAFFGGVGGGLLGAACGRIFTSVTGPVSGLAAGALTGGLIGGSIGFFCWYWGAVFRFRQWPAGDETSLLALVGVGGALLGAATAAGIGGAREA